MPNDMFPYSEFPTKPQSGKGLKVWRSFGVEH